LLDAELLAAVYVELTTTRQAAWQLEPIAARPSNIQTIVRAPPKPLPPGVTADDRNAPREFVRTPGKDAVWLDYFTIRSVAAGYSLVYCPPRRSFAPATAIRYRSRRGG
jgi:hypothetical protein